MPSTSSRPLSASSPRELQRVLEDVFRRGDADAFMGLHEPDATVRIPPDGQLAHGPVAIRAAAAPILAMQPHLTSTVLALVEADGIALTHARSVLRVDREGADLVEMCGRGTIVSRPRQDGSWGIVVDDPMTPE